MEVVIEEMTVNVHATDRSVGEGIRRELARLLEDRLRSLRHDPAADGALDLGTVDLGSVPMPASRDAAATAGLIADRLVAWLQGVLTQPQEAP
jgi:hypothetical protein